MKSQDSISELIKIEYDINIMPELIVAYGIIRDSDSR